MSRRGSWPVPGLSSWTSSVSPEDGWGGARLTATWPESIASYIDAPLSSSTPDMVWYSGRANASGEEACFDAFRACEEFDRTAVPEVRIRTGLAAVGEEQTGHRICHAEVQAPAALSPQDRGRSRLVGPVGALRLIPSFMLASTASHPSSSTRSFGLVAAHSIASASASHAP